MTTRGLVLGKFMPPHAGHVFLCDFARHHCDQLTILVCSLEREPIAGELRAGWMGELFPDCRIVHHTKDVPQEPGEHPDFWPIWRGIVQDAHPQPLDFVYASEAYGHRLAAELGARFVPVDLSRETFPVSGTAVRARPFGTWDFIPPPVRPYYVKRVCLFGPESSGKTTLARWLAERFSTLAVPEYGRTYTETFGTEVTMHDLASIAAGHRAAAAAGARVANRLLVLDTDAVLTAVWSHMLVGAAHPELADIADVADLYLLTDIDIPWVDDGTRYFPEPEQRRAFIDLCRAELDRRALPYVVVSGTLSERCAAAEAAVRAAFPGLEATGPDTPPRLPRP